MEIFLEHIPAELRESNQIVVYGVSKKNLKMPFNPNTLAPAKAGVPSTWGTLEQAMEAVKSGKAQGIGYEFNNNAIYGIDLDGVLVDGKLTPEAQYIVDKLDSYTEISPSGTGLHVFVRASNIDLKHNRKGFIEIYNRERYFTLTGNVYGCVKPIMERLDELQDVYNQYLSQPESKKVNPVNLAKSITYNAEDSKYVKIGLQKDSVFQSLWNGDRPNSNESADDLALFNKRAYWCDNDEELMISMFMDSLHYLQKDDSHKKKCDRYDYLPRTAQKAVESTKMTASETDKQYEISSSNGVRKVIDTNNATAHKDDSNEGSFDFSPYDYSDAGNSEAFCARFKGEVIFVKALGWLVWNGNRWYASKEQASGKAKQFSKEMYNDSLSKITEGGRAQLYLKHAQATRNAPKIRNLLELSRSSMMVELEQLDSNPYLLNTPKGLVDLRTGEVMPHDPKYLCTCITSTSMNGNGVEEWDNFLDVITNSDNDLKQFLQIWAGMVAIGEVFEERLLIAHGNGNNGKSTFFNSLQRVLGNYSMSIPSETLTSDKQNKRAVLAELKGKRLIIAAELEEGKRLSISIVKQLTSTDKIAAERKYKDPEDFTPSHSTVLFTNHKPKVGSLDRGIWRRLLLVSFDAVIDPSKDIKNYANYLFEKCGGAILAWIVEGAIRFCNNNHELIIPESIRKATDDYMASNDWLCEFIEEYCVTGDGKMESSSKLHGTYKNWATARGDYVRDTRDFKVEMERRGFDSKKKTKGIFYLGLKLKEAYEGNQTSQNNVG